MNLQTLSQLATAGEIVELEFLSLEGGFYIARARLKSGGQRVLVDAKAKPMHLRSTTHLRDVLQSVPPFPCVLVQHCVHDEMCANREGPIEALRIPFLLTTPRCSRL